MDKSAIFITSLLASLILIFSIDYPMQGDESSYDILGWNIAQGRGFSVTQDKSFSPSMDREPVYPFFLAFAYLMFGHWRLPVQLMQIMFFLTTGIITYLLAKELFGSRIARYSFIGILFCPTLLSYPAFLYSEIMATLLVLLTLYYLTLAIKKENLIWYILSGIFLGIAMLCKSVLVLYGLLAALCIIFIKGYTKKESFLYALVFVFSFLLVIFPWVDRNYRIFNKPSISLRGGKVLWMRAEKLDYSSRNILKHLIFILSESLGDKFYPDDKRERPSDVYFEDSLRSDQYLLDLENKGHNHSQIDNIFYQEAICKIMAHPLKYILQTPIEGLKMLSFIYLPALNQPHIIDKLEKSGPLFQFSGIFIKGIMRFFSYSIFVLSFIAMYLRRKQYKDWILLAVIILYINLIHSLLFGDGRYAVVIIPFYMIFASVGVVSLLKNER